MQYDEFVGKVQNKARLATSGEAVKAIRSTLEVLSQRLYGGAADNLAAQLPEEIGRYLADGKKNESFGLDEFFERVSKIESADLPVAVHHTRAVISVLKEAVSAGEFEKVRAQLPEEYDPLFDAGSEGEMTR